MLILERKNQESLMIGGLNGRGPPIVITVVEIVNGHVKLGITASPEISIDRSEVHERKLLQPGAMPESHPECMTGANSHVAP
jgi:carbon storage regulator CsrA